MCAQPATTSIEIRRDQPDLAQVLKKQVKCVSSRIEMNKRLLLLLGVTRAYRCDNTGVPDNALPVFGRRHAL